MATNKPKIMESLGNQQTGYADWAKSMLMNYPFNPTFKKNGEVVEVFYNDEKFSIPLKKLETLIKISEALCRMRLSNHVNIDDVFESVKIFKEGTMGYF